MLRIDQYDVAVRDLLRNKQAAKSDDARQAWDQIWSDMLVARSHALLVDRFRNDSASARQQAALSATQLGNRREAEAYRVRATQLHETAERHAKLADEYQEKAESAMSDATAMSKRDNEGQQEGGQNGNVPRQRRQADRRQVNESPQQEHQPEQQQKEEYPHTPQ